MKRITLSFCLFALCLAGLFRVAKGQSSTYLNATGNPSFGVNFPIENGFINISNGNLHMEFPFATHPQRGALNLNERLVYDSRIWMIGCYSNCYFWPNNIPNTPNTQAGWRFVTGAETGALGSFFTYAGDYTCDADASSGNHFHGSTQYFTWSDPSGTVHTFDAAWSKLTSDCGNAPSNPQSISGSATDASGYSIQGSGYSDGDPTIAILDNTGTQVYPQIIDRYGNYFSSDTNGNVIDSVGRTPIIVTKSGSITYYDVLAPNGPINNNGTRVRYIVTTAPVSIGTTFNPSGQLGVQDWNGTLSPVQNIQLPNGSSYTFSYDNYGELSSVTLPTGGVITYDWRNFADSAGGVNRWAYSRTVGGDPATTFTPTVISYCQNYATGCQEAVVLHKASGDETVYELTLNNGAWNTDTRVYTGSATPSHVIAETASTYDFSHPCNSVICNGAQYITKATETTSFLVAGIQSQTQYVYSNPALGKPTAVKEWGYYPTGGTPSTTPTRETDYSYTGFDTQQVTILDSNGNQAGRTTYGYTSTATATSGVAQHGTQNAGGPYLQSITHWLNTGTSPATTYTSDDTGMITSITDANQNPATGFTYQCSNSLPNQVTNPLSQTTAYGYDCNSGAATYVKDPNDLAASRSGTVYSYEANAGRVHTVTYPDNGQTTYSYPSYTEVDTAVLSTPNPMISSADVVDSFGRSYQHIQGGVSSETTYDANGRVNCVTNPHFTSSSSTTDGSTCITSYDGLDRPLIQSQQDGTSLKSWLYSGNTATSYDESGRQWKHTSNAFGQLTKVLEPASSDGPTTLCGPQGCRSLPAATFETDYAYDGLNNLTTVTQLGGAGDTSRVRTFTYDSLSRLVCSAHPESSSNNCPVSAAATMPTGVTSYGYDANGNVTTKSDSSAYLTITYDAINRMKVKYGAWLINAYNYDDPGFSNSIGRMTLSSSDYGFTTYNYDTMGRVLNSNNVIATYDLAGNLSSLVYPDGRKIVQVFDASGHLAKVSSPSSGSIPAYDYISGGSPLSGYTGPTTTGGITYTPAGQEQSFVLGSNIVQSSGFDARLQPCQTLAGSLLPGNTQVQLLVNRQYFYSQTAGTVCTSVAANNGNIMAIDDGLQAGNNQTFTYDSVNRLSSASQASGSYNHSYSLDAFGNMMFQDNLHTPASYSINAKNQLQLNSNQFTYSNGGLLSSTGPHMYGGHNYQYDEANQLQYVDSDDTATEIDYQYDGLQQRIQKNIYPISDNPRYIYFNGQVIEVNRHDSSGNFTTIDYIYANGRRIAQTSATVANVLHHSGVCGNCSGGASNFYLSGFASGIVGYTIRNGDKLVFQQQQTNARAGLYMIAGDNSNSMGSLFDQNGDTINASSVADGTWHTRVVDLSNWAGKTISSNIGASVESNTPTGVQWDSYIADVALISTDGTVQPLFTGQSISFSPWGSGAGSNFALSSSTQPLPVATRYFLSDHLGTTQMELSGGGWPVWKGQFTPFGVELDSQYSFNPYRFTGQERDPETADTTGNGLDYFNARYYSSTFGRFTSPDPYDGSMNLSDPQSLNRYSYVGNHPLSSIDPSGLDGQSSIPGVGGLGGCLGAAASEGANIGADLGCAYTIFTDIASFFQRPHFAGTTKPRPNAQPWDEYHIHYGPNIAGALGLPSNGCEFGACGGGVGSFQQGVAGAIGGTIVCQIAEPCGAIEDTALIVGTLIVGGLDIYNYYRGRTNVADTGITSEAQQLVSSGKFSSICAALAFLQSTTRDSARLQKIKATQKAFGCRRNSTQS